MGRCSDLGDDGAAADGGNRPTDADRPMAQLAERWPRNGIKTIRKEIWAGAPPIRDMRPQRGYGPGGNEFAPGNFAPRGQ